jgi:hypothetical protein
MRSMRPSRRGSFPREDRGLTRLLAALVVAAVLAGCGRDDSEAHHHGWVLHSQVKFFSADFQVVSQPLPRSAFRLLFSYIAGDIYGPVTTPDLIHPFLNDDLSFDIDFGSVQQDLNRELQPTEFRLEFLKIEPAEARIARLTPLVLQPDGVDPVATADWIDGVTHQQLMLVYVDRPCRITGALARNDYTVRYSVRAAAAGYIWIAGRQTQDGQHLYTEVTQPATVYLALTPAEPAVHPPPPGGSPQQPPANVPRKAVSPAHTDIPAP